MKNHNGTRNSSKTFFNFLTGPVKIKDGLFMGDEVAARVLILLNLWGYGFHYQ